ncbi:hypothetical protein R6Z07F_018588 [Ovis aries]
MSNLVRHLSELLRGRGRRGKMLKTDNHTARFSCAAWPLTRRFLFVLSPLNDPIRLGSEAPSGNDFCDCPRLEWIRTQPGLLLPSPHSGRISVGRS